MIRTSRFLRIPTEPIDVNPDEKISDLLKSLRHTGFQGRKLAEITEIWVRMLRKKNCIIWMGLAGAMAPAGMRKDISYLEAASEILRNIPAEKSAKIETMGNRNANATKNTGNAR